MPYGACLMANVYSVNANKKIIIYENGNNIYLRTARNDSIDRPVILSNNYLGFLSECIYNNTLYYAFQDNNRDCLVKSIMDSKPIFRLNSNEVLDCTHPLLAIINANLLLFYMLKNPLKDNYQLKFENILVDNATLINLPSECENVLNFDIFQFSQTSFLYIQYTKSDPNATTSINSEYENTSHSTFFEIYKIEKNGHLCKLENSNILQSNIQSNIQSIIQSKEKEFKNTLDNYTQEITMLYRKVDSLQKEKQSFTGMLHQLENNTISLQNQVKDYAKNIKVKDALIESIKAQYNELMQVATAYKTELERQLTGK